MSLADLTPNAAPGLIPQGPLAEPIDQILAFVSSGGPRALPDCTVPPLSQNAVCNISLSIEDRAYALVEALTPGERYNASSSVMPAVERLGLPPLILWNEGLRGVGASLCVTFEPNGGYSYATSFPQPITMAAAFDDELIYDVADCISTEMRAFANGGHAGLGVFTPNINPFKDPRWGRGKETPGEDPFRVSSYTTALLSGLEAAKAHDVKKIVATCKHFAAYDLEYFHNVSRYQFNAEVRTQDLAEYYMPSFEACARDMQAGSTMCSYNAVNGVPSCANDWLMQDILRDHWKWNAPDHYISSDCFAIDVIETAHNYTTTHEQTAAVAMKAGTDNDCGAFYRAHLGAAVNQSLVDMDVVNRAVARAYGGMIRVGYFDPPSTNPYRDISWSAVNTPASRSLARKSATSGMALLKNLNSTLPLKSPDGCGKNLSIALVGEWANATLDMIAGYSGTPPFLHSPLYGLQQISGVTVNLAEGLNDTSMAMNAADKSDIVIYVGGGDESSEAEGLDRTSIAWNSTQSALIDAMASVGKPFVIVKTGATQLDDSAWLANDNVSAILWMGYPGQDGGPAMADVLFGKVAPAGRLPVTQYPSSYIDKVSEFDMSLRPHQDSPGRTYKWYSGEAVLPFGYGLHYTNFSVKAWSRDLHTNMSSDGLIQNCSTPAYEHIDRCVIGNIEVAVSNTRDTCSDYVALVFVNGDFGPEPCPLKSLVAYDRLHDVTPGEIQYASMALTLGSIARWDEQGRRILYPGTYRVAIDTEPELAEFRRCWKSGRSRGRTEEVSSGDQQDVSMMLWAQTTTSGRR